MSIMSGITTIKIRKEVLEEFDALYRELGGKEVFGSKEQFLYALVSYVKDNVPAESFLLHFFEKSNPKLLSVLRTVLGKSEQKDQESEREEILPYNDADAHVLREKLL